MRCGVTTLATDSTDSPASGWRVRIRDVALSVLPRANPNHERWYPQVRSWALEFDEQGWPQREVGLDASGQPLLRAPDDRNTGFWVDMAYRQFDPAELGPLSKEEFEVLWRSD